jgi:transcriptional regulator with XRE-family HTH domain
MPDDSYNKRLGQQMRAVRKGLKFSLQRVSEMSNGEFRSSVLGAYERADRHISVDRLQRLAEIYGVPVERFLPADGDVIDIRDRDVDLIDQMSNEDKLDEFRTLRKLAIDLTDEATRAVAMRQASTDPKASPEYVNTLQRMVALIDDVQTVAADLRHIRRHQASSGGGSSGGGGSGGGGSGDSGGSALPGPGGEDT